MVCCLSKSECVVLLVRVNVVCCLSKSECVVLLK